MIAYTSLLAFTAWGCSISPELQAEAPIQELAKSLPNLDRPSSVKTIQQVIAQNSPATTQIAGLVNQHIPLVEQWLYQIQDGSGQLWVLTPLPPPPVGSQVTLEAEIKYEPISMGETDVGEHYALEIKRLEAVEAEPIATPPSADPQ